MRNILSLISLRAKTTSVSAAKNYDYSDLGDSSELPLVNGMYTALIKLTYNGELQFWVGTSLKTEMKYLDGITSSIQTQLDSKSGSYFTTFTNADLVTGVLTVIHNLGTRLCGVIVFNNSNKICFPDDITLSSSTSCTVDLSSYGTLSGTWGVRVIK